MDLNQLERAAVAASIIPTPPKTFDVGPAADIRLAEGTGHLLDGATITAWDDVLTGRCE